MRLFKRGRIFYGWFYQDGVKVQRSTRCTDRRAAEAVLRRWERAAADPDHATREGALVRHALALVLDRIDELVTTGRRSAETARFYRSKVGHLSRLLELDGVPAPLSSLTAATIDRYVSARRREPRTNDVTIAKEIGVLRLALRLAKRAGIWRGDTAEMLPELDAKPVPRTRHLTRSELQRLLAELVPDRGARVAFIVATSARLGESDRAQRGDVLPGFVGLRGTKTPRARRIVPLVLPEQQQLVDIALARAEGTAALFAPWGNVRRDLEAACARAGIPKCSPNDLRRTFAHWLRGEGAPSDLVALAMGHVDSRMVERVYGRLEGKDLAAALALAVARVHQLPRTAGTSADSADYATAQIQAEPVPRVGIEPTTRGFSIRALWPKSRVDTRKRQRGVAHVHQLRSKGRMGS